jgi:methylmalonyl-CoA mutase
MKRKNIQQLTLKSAVKKADTSSVVPFSTAEHIELKQSYHKSDVEKLEHLGFGAGFAPNLRGPYATMYVRRPWTFVNMPDFQQLKKVMLFTEEI